MHCDRCGADFAAPALGRVPYNYGPPNVVLAGVKVRHCTRCDNYAFDVPRILQLHRALAEAVEAARHGPAVAAFEASYTAGQWQADER